MQIFLTSSQPVLSRIAEIDGLMAAPTPSRADRDGLSGQRLSRRCGFWKKAPPAVSACVRPVMVKTFSQSCIRVLV